MNNAITAAVPPVVLMIRANPLDGEWTRCEYPHGATLAEMLAGASDDWRALVDGVEVPRAEWVNCRPEPGALVTMLRAPGEPFSLTATLTMFLYNSVGLSGMYAGLLAKVVVGALAIGASMGFNMVMNALVSPQSPSLGRSGAASTRYSSLTSGQNRANPFGPLPRLYGRCRIYPPLAANYYTVSETTGSDGTIHEQYLYALFSLSYGPLSIDGHKVGPKLDGSGRYPKLTNATALQAHTIRIGDTNIGNYSGVQYEIGGIDDITLYPDTVKTTPLSLDIDIGESLVQTTDADAYDATIEITCPALYNMTGEGTIAGATQYFKVEYRPSPSGQWVAFGFDKVVNGQTYSFSIGNKSYVPLTFDYKIWFPSAGTYDIRLTRLNEWPMVHSPPGSSQARWTAIKSHVAGPAWEPYKHKQSTVMAIRVKASGQLNGVLDTVNILATAVVRVWDGTAWAEEGNRNPAWAFYDALTGPQMSQPVDENQIDKAALKGWADECYAAGRFYNWYHQDSETLLDRLRAIARCGRAEWALRDTKFTVVRDTNDEPIQVISPRNAWGFRMSKTFAPRPHALRVRYVAGDAVAENGTITPGSGEQTERIVLDDGYQIDGKDALGASAPGLPAATRFDVLETQGVDNADQAFKEGRYHLAQLRLRPEVWTVQMDAENLVATRGDTVRLAYDAIMVGLAYGRIKSLSGTALVLDESVTMAGNKTYAVRLRKSDGSSAVVGVTTVAGTTSALTLASSPVGYAPGDLVVFGESGIESVAAKVLSIEYAPDMSATLTLTPAAMPDILTADSEAIPAYNPAINGSIEKRLPPVPRLTAVASDRQDLESNSAGLTTAGVRVAWVVQASDVSVDTVDVKIAPVTADAFQVQVLTLPADAGSCAFKKLPLDTAAEVSIQSHSVWGKVSGYGTPWGITTVAAADAPEPAGRYLILSASAQSFTYDGHGQPAPANQTITLTVKTSRLDGFVPSFTATAYNASNQVILPAPTLTGTGSTRTLTVANFGAADHVEITASQGGKSDTVTIARADDGVSSVTGSLSKSHAYVSAESDGSGYSLADAYGVFEVYDGAAYKSDSGQVAFTTYTTSGVTASIDSLGNYAVSALSGEEGTAIFRAIYNNGDVSATIFRAFRVGKVRKGVQGDTGSNAQTLTLSSTAQAITYGKRGVASPLSQTITFTANLQNLAGTATFTATNYDSNGVNLGSVTLGGSGNTRTLTRAPGNDQFGSAAYCVVTATLGGVSDTMTVVRLQDGLDTVVGVLTNESALVASDKDGNVASFANAGGTYRLWEGATEITTGNGVVYSVPFSYSTTVSINSSTGAYTVSALSADEGSATLRATYDGQTYDKVYSIAKAKVGQTGAQGLRSQAIRLSATAKTFTYDTVGAASPGSQTITVTADLQNVSGTATFTCELFNTIGGSQGTITMGGSGNTRTITNAQFGTAAYAVIIAEIGGDNGTLSDVTRVVRVTDGARAQNIRLSADTNFFTFDESGAALPSGQVVTITANTQNNSNTVSFGADLLDANGGYVGGATLLGSGNSRTLNVSQFYSTSIVRCKIVASIQGDNGTQTDVLNVYRTNAGASSKIIKLSASDTQFTYGIRGNAFPVNQTITFNALLQNLSGTATFTATKYDSNGNGSAATLGGSGNTRTLAIADFGSSYSCVVTATLGSYSDSVVVYSLVSARASLSIGTTEIDANAVTYNVSAEDTTIYQQPSYAWMWRQLYGSGVISSTENVLCRVWFEMETSRNASYWSGGTDVDLQWAIWDNTAGSWLSYSPIIYSALVGSTHKHERIVTIPANHTVSVRGYWMPSTNGGKVSTVYGAGGIQAFKR